MHLFTCSCNNKTPLFFENTVCHSCQRVVGFSDYLQSVVALDQRGSAYYCKEDPDAAYQLCDNYKIHQACNGLLRSETGANAELSGLCFACHFNQVIPSTDEPRHVELWRKLETAKRRALYSLVKLGLPIVDRNHDPLSGLCFKFLADKEAAGHFTVPLPDQPPVYTGHQHGEITINIQEADEVARARQKNQVGEQYRTLLGHFRHELGHFYWEQWFRDDAGLQSFRDRFGDERQDYQAALNQHYEQGAMADWQQNYISAYASLHPWEDWAETFAHYLHMIDTLETAQGFGLQLSICKNGPEDSSAVTDTKRLALPQNPNSSIGTSSFPDMIDTWMSFTVMLNSINRSMGIEDAYPFVLTPAVLGKLKTVHDYVQHSAYAKRERL